MELEWGSTAKNHADGWAFPLDSFRARAGSGERGSELADEEKGRDANRGLDWDMGMGGGRSVEAPEAP